MNINTNLQQLKGSYLFTEITNRTQVYRSAHPDQCVLRLGVGDVTRPLPPVIVQAMQSAAAELGQADSFRGYGPEDGYTWLKQAIIDNDFAPRGVSLTTDEVFISDGAGSDLGNLSELFTVDNRVAILDPSYPAYIDSNRMAGREITYLPCTEANAFVPELPKQRADIIYLCLPNNPTGTVLRKSELQQWVDYAIANHSIIIFDAAYEAFIADPDIPHSIYELPGAKQVAIEVRSFSKFAGFTAVRCGYTVVPRETGLQAMWLRRQCTKYNGTSYIAQRAAMAVYTPEGRQGIEINLTYYRRTAELIRSRLSEMGYRVYGGVNAPYIWCRTPEGVGSWEFFDRLLNRCQVVCTPGAGFGEAGEGFVRFSAFSPREDCIEALDRMKTL